jgi:hypothetical protein
MKNVINTKEKRTYQLSGIIADRGTQWIFHFFIARGVKKGGRGPSTDHEGFLES